MRGWTFAVALAVLAAAGWWDLATPARAEAPVTAALLTLADLPVGWVDEAVPADGAADLGGGTFCVQPSPVRALSEPSEERAEAWFQRGRFGPVIYHVIVRAVDAAAIMDGVRALPPPCAWGTEEDGEVTPWRLQAASCPAPGEDSAAFRLTADWGFGSLDADLVFVRRGEVISAILHAAAGLVGPPALDSKLTGRLARLVDERMAAVAP